jgi:ketosteroid isomerase-like protein
MSTQEVANRFYQLAQQGNWYQILDDLFAEDAKSIEPENAMGLPTVSGLSKIREKGKIWENMIEQVHGGFCNEPQVVANYFTCTMGTDITPKDGQRTTMDEVAVYEVRNGKIVSEQFFY